MPWFGIGKKQEGWMALRCAAERVDLAHVRCAPGGRPEVMRLETYRNEGTLADSLARLRKSLHLERYRCATVLAQGSYQMVQIEAPNVPPEELRQAVRWKVKDLLDGPVENATLDLIELPVESTSGRTRQLFVVAAGNAVIRETMQEFDGAGVPLEVIDIPELAQRNVAALFEPENRGLAMLAFDEVGGLLTFSYGGELYLARRIEVSAAQLQQADAERRGQLVERIGLELQRSLDHFDRQFNFISLAKLLVVPVPGVPELGEYLAANLYVPLEVLDLARVMDFPAIPELRKVERQAECLHLLGTALRAGSLAA